MDVSAARLRRRPDRPAREVLASAESVVDSVVTPYLQDPDLTLHQGDVQEVLRQLPDESVQMCVTSPPYWGLRDYGTGVWEGGDSDCDHIAPYSPQTDRANGKPTGTRGEQPNTHRSGGQFKQTCGKCGASRTDSQLGLEAPGRVRGEDG